MGLGREEPRLPVLAGIGADAGGRGMDGAARARARRRGLAAVLARLHIHHTQNKHFIIYKLVFLYYKHTLLQISTKHKVYIPIFNLLC